jgi:sarcosine oxidase subunit alpha
VLDRSIAMALLVSGHSRHGETVTISLDGRTVNATVTKPVFYDEEGEIIRG